MRLYLVVNKDTGELESFCEVCGIKGMGNNDDPAIIQVDENHTAIEVTQEELDAMSASLREGEEPHIIEYGVKLDPERMKRTLAEREKVKDLSRPIEVDGIGGKEIIGYEDKPENVLVEREKKESKKDDTEPETPRKAER